MSNSVFPMLPGLDIAVQRTPIYKTTIHESLGGKEDRASWQATPRYQYDLKFNFLRDNVAAPAPWAAYSEAGVILNFLDAHAGSLDSFLYDDPYPGAAQARVRFIKDSIAVTKIVDHVWSGSATFISVK